MLLIFRFFFFFFRTMDVLLGLSNPLANISPLRVLWSCKYGVYRSLFNVTKTNGVTPSAPGNRSMTNAFRYDGKKKNVVSNEMNGLFLHGQNSTDIGSKLSTWQQSPNIYSFQCLPRAFLSFLQPCLLGT